MHGIHIRDLFDMKVTSLFMEGNIKNCFVNSIPTTITSGVWFAGSILMGENYITHCKIP
jgi:hypothetical protein